LENTFIHETAHVSKAATIGNGTKIWINVQIREETTVGENCVLGKDVYIAEFVKIGNDCKIQNGVSVFTGVTIEDDVFVGPDATFTNDIVPRAFKADWKIVPTMVKKGASIGANATIICGVTLGEYCMVAAGSVVTKDVEPYSLVMGNPARHYRFIDKMGNKIDVKDVIAEPT
jgi:UDP-2-acetamido-3-amino-2,3-dideoxy-glucuronate N-acetyltransferase